MVAVVVHDHFLVDLKNCTVVGLDGKFVKTVRGDAHVPLKLESVFLQMTKLLKVKGTRSSRCCPDALFEVLRASEIAVEDRVGEPRSSDAIGHRFQVRPAQESRSIHNAPPSSRGNHDEVESGLLVLRKRNLEGRLVTPGLIARRAAIEGVVNLAAWSDRPQLDGGVILVGSIEVLQPIRLRNSVINTLPF